MAKNNQPTIQPVPREAIADVRGESEFVELLRRELSWPIPERLERLDEVVIPLDLQQDFGFPAGEDRIRVSRLFSLSEDQPWGIFLFEFKTKRPYMTHLRRLLRVLGSRRTLREGDPIWNRSDLLFICTRDWTEYQFVHFAGEKPESAVISSFGWTGPEDPFLHTLCKHNLPLLRLPETDDTGKIDPEKWRSQWSNAFNIKPVTDEFYRTLKEVFDAVQSGVKGLKGENRRFFAELLVNRLIFLKFVEKKGWLAGDTDYLFNRFKQHGRKNYWRNFLFHFFFEGLNTEPRQRTPKVKELLGDVPFLNAELFSKSDKWDDEAVEVVNNVFDLVFDKLLNPYNFTVCETSPLDVEVAFNQDLLGYGYEELIADQHGQGAYYTHPTEVNLMCRESLRAYLEARCPEVDKEIIGKLVYGELSESASIAPPPHHDLLQLYQALHEVTVVDPALGSGTFPVAMMKHLFLCLTTLGAMLKGVAAFQSKIKSQALTDPADAFSLKLHIIEKSLYGCDIDYFAVQIAKLRFWIELMVNCDKPSALPNFDFKLVVGDALVSVVGTTSDGKPIALENILGHPTKGQQSLNKIYVEQYAELKRKYFAVKASDECEELRTQIEEAKEKLLINLGISIPKSRRTDKHVLWQIDFAEIFSGENPGFDIAIANPPYLRQELIDKTFIAFDIPVTKVILRTLYQKMLTEDVDGKADIFIYFFFRSLMLLRQDRGVQCFICSTSWMDDDFGAPLQKYLSKNCSVGHVFENQEKRSFESADINAAISIFTHTMENKVDAEFNFVSFGKTIVPAPFDAIDSSGKINDKFYKRTRVAKKDLFPQLGKHNVLIKNGKWGTRFLRMPSCLKKLIDLNKEKFVFLGDLCSFEYGTKPGIVEFFILDTEKIKHYGIEEQFIHPIITSTREIENLTIEKKKISKFVFSCPHSKSFLRSNKLRGALSYIEWGEAQISVKGASHTVAGIPWPDVTSVSTNKPYWYSVRLKKPGHFVVPALIRERFFYAQNRHRLYDTNMFYHGTFDDETDVELSCAILNSTITYFVTEVYGRLNIGGRLNLYGTEYLQLPILSPQKVDILSKNRILEAYNALSIKNVMPITEEINKEERKVLDMEIIRGLNLHKAVSIELIYESFCEMVFNRIQRETSEGN